jgi:hypothetical protein
MKLEDLGTINIDYMIKVMQHYKDGGKVGYIHDDLDCDDGILPSPAWNWVNYTYYIIEAPKVNINELRDEWFKLVGLTHILKFTRYDTNTATAFPIKIGKEWITIEDFRKRFTFEDGSEIPEIDFGGVE